MTPAQVVEAYEARIVALLESVRKELRLLGFPSEPPTKAFLGEEGDPHPTSWYWTVVVPSATLEKLDDVDISFTVDRQDSYWGWLVTSNEATTSLVSRTLALNKSKKQLEASFGILGSERMREVIIASTTEWLSRAVTRGPSLPGTPIQSRSWSQASIDSGGEIYLDREPVGMVGVGAVTDPILKDLVDGWGLLDALRDDWSPPEFLAVRPYAAFNRATGPVFAMRFQFEHYYDPQTGKTYTAKQAQAKRETVLALVSELGKHGYELQIEPDTKPGDWTHTTFVATAVDPHPLVWLARRVLRLARRVGWS